MSRSTEPSRDATSAAHSATTERVLEQPVAVGVMIAHGGGSHDECGPRFAGAVEGALEEGAQMGVVHRVDERVKALAEFAGVDRRTWYEF